MSEQSSLAHEAATRMSQARMIMVDSQVRPNQVNDRRVIAAMRDLPRENFAPAGAQAYTDADIPLGGGRVMPAPMLIARLVQLVLANSPKHVLVVGAGSGYGAALLARCGAHVVALEEEARLCGSGLARHAPAVERAQGRLTGGWGAGGPYDAILIEGAVPEIPRVFAEQLAPGGRIVAILSADGAPGRVVLAERSGAGLAHTSMFDCCTAPVLPQFTPAPEFRF